MQAAGWTVIRVWEHEPVEDAVVAIEEVLDGRQVGLGGRSTTSRATPP